MRVKGLVYEIDDAIKSHFYSKVETEGKVTEGWMLRLAEQCDCSDPSEQRDNYRIDDDDSTAATPKQPIKKTTSTASSDSDSHSTTLPMQGEQELQRVREPSS